MRQTGGWRAKTLHELPEESKQIYIKMTRYIEKRDRLDEMLSQSLVFEDLSKVGFLRKQQIKNVYAGCQM